MSYAVCVCKRVIHCFKHIQAEYTVVEKTKPLGAAIILEYFWCLAWATVGGDFWYGILLIWGPWNMDTSDNFEIPLIWTLLVASPSKDTPPKPNMTMNKNQPFEDIYIYTSYQKLVIFQQSPWFPVSWENSPQSWTFNDGTSGFVQQHLYQSTM